MYREHRGDGTRNYDRRRDDERPDEKPSEDVCWGRNPVISLLEDSPERCTKVLMSKTIQPHVRAKIQDLCRAANVVFQFADAAALDRTTGRENHQGVVAWMAPVELREAEEFIASLPAPPAAAMLLLCDHIQDPHNLGAVVRSAEAAGASGVLIPKRGGCLPTGTVVKTSAGAALRLPIAKTGNVSQTIRLLQEANFWVVGLAMEGTESLFKGDLPKRLALVVGAEGEGLGTAVSKACDELRSIPMKGGTGSLNASVAAALAMFEWARSNN